MVPPDVRSGYAPQGNPDQQGQRYNYDQVKDLELRRFLGKIEGIVVEQRWPFEAGKIFRNVYPVAAGVGMGLTSILFRSVNRHGVLTLKGGRSHTLFTSETFRAFAVLDWIYKALFAKDIRTVYDLPDEVDVDELQQIVTNGRALVHAYPHIATIIYDPGAAPNEHTRVRTSPIDTHRQSQPIERSTPPPIRAQRSQKTLGEIIVWDNNAHQLAVQKKPEPQTEGFVKKDPKILEREKLIRMRGILEEVLADTLRCDVAGIERVYNVTPNDNFEHISWRNLSFPLCQIVMFIDAFGNRSLASFGVDLETATNGDLRRALTVCLEYARQDETLYNLAKIFERVAMIVDRRTK